MYGIAVKLTDVLSEGQTRLLERWDLCQQIFLYVVNFKELSNSKMTLECALLKYLLWCDANCTLSVCAW